MKQLIPSLRSALATCCEGDELQTIVKALCCELLGIDEYTYYLKEDVTLTEVQTDTLREAVRRLLRGEPLQYILGSAPFAGFTLQVDGRVLIPRPETSQLVRLALERGTDPLQLPLKGEGVPPCREGRGGSPSFLDAGTGSGCIAIALAKADREIEVIACDISEEALAVARSNALANDADIRFIKADLLSLLADALPRPHLNPPQRGGLPVHWEPQRNCTPSPLGRAGVGPSLPEALQGVEVDCIVSNPPYIRESERVFMEERVLGWEPALALFVPDGDPLLFYRALALLGQTPLLRPGGALCVEINRDFGFETSVLFHLYGYKDIRVHPDLFGNERFVTCRKKNVGNQ